MAPPAVAAAGCGAGAGATASAWLPVGRNSMVAVAGTMMKPTMPTHSRWRQFCAQAWPVRCIHMGSAAAAACAGLPPAPVWPAGLKFGDATSRNSSQRAQLRQGGQGGGQSGRPAREQATSLPSTARVAHSIFTWQQGGGFLGIGLHTSAHDDLLSRRFFYCITGSRAWLPGE